ncbi:hypothetical protein F5Y15DRAFT_421548 [Xylariaceae sp. FL0016]|nr:hypothetical protein F5Y15DRAFT_421548 [Xylariaceae sp. FL0016]
MASSSDRTLPFRPLRPLRPLVFLQGVGRHRPKSPQNPVNIQKAGKPPQQGLRTAPLLCPKPPVKIMHPGSVVDYFLNQSAKRIAKRHPEQRSRKATKDNMTNVPIGMEAFFRIKGCQTDDEKRFPCPKGYVEKVFVVGGVKTREFTRLVNGDPDGAKFVIVKDHLVNYEPSVRRNENGEWSVTPLRLSPLSCLSTLRGTRDGLDVSCGNQQESNEWVDVDEDDWADEESSERTKKPGFEANDPAAIAAAATCNGSETTGNAGMDSDTSWDNWDSLSKGYEPEHGYGRGSSSDAEVPFGVQDFWPSKVSPPGFDEVWSSIDLAPLPEPHVPSPETGHHHQNRMSHLQDYNQETGKYMMTDAEKRGTAVWHDLNAESKPSTVDSVSVDKGKSVICNQPVNGEASVAKGKHGALKSSSGSSSAQKQPGRKQVRWDDCPEGTTAKLELDKWLKQVKRRNHWRPNLFEEIIPENTKKSWPFLSIETLEAFAARYREFVKESFRDFRYDYAKNGLIAHSIDAEDRIKDRFNKFLFQHRIYSDLNEVLMNDVMCWNGQKREWEFREPGSSEVKYSIPRPWSKEDDDNFSTIVEPDNELQHLGQTNPGDMNRGIIVDDGGNHAGALDAPHKLADLGDGVMPIHRSTGEFKTVQAILIQREALLHPEKQDKPIDYIFEGLSLEGLNTFRALTIKTILTEVAPNDTSEQRGLVTKLNSDIDKAKACGMIRGITAWPTGMILDTSPKKEEEKNPKEVENLTKAEGNSPIKTEENSPRRAEDKNPTKVEEEEERSKKDEAAEANKLWEAVWGC